MGEKETEDEKERRVEGGVPARAGAGDKQLHGFHGSTRRAKSALISGSRACRKRGEARRTRGSLRRRTEEVEGGKKGMESKNRMRGGERLVCA